MVSRTNIRGVEANKTASENDANICIDPASSEFYTDGKYHLRTESTVQSAVEMTDYYGKLLDQFPIVLLEDGLAEDGWAGQKHLHDKQGGRVKLADDDLFVTNVKYIRRGTEENLASVALIRLNQIDSLSEIFGVVVLCQQHD